MSTDSISSLAAASVAVSPVSRLVLVRPSSAEAVESVDETQASTDQLSEAVAELNRYVAGSRTDLRFAIDQEADEVVVSIVDSETGQVLRQIPSVEAMRIARYLEHDRLGLIRQRA
jgi:flagellar protein FlaG